MTTNKKGPGIRCVECGAWLDPGERCDCAKTIAKQREARKSARTREIVANNIRMMERAATEWEYA